MSPAADDDPPQHSPVERWLSFGATIIAPATVLSAVLFYFGYVSARAQYEYFGVDVDAIGLSTRDYVMRSPQPLLVPLLVLTLLGVGGLAMHTTLRRHIAARGDEGVAIAAFRQRTRRASVAGLAVLGLGVLLLFAYPYVRDWPLFNLVTPLLIGLGASGIAYASHVRSLLTGRTRGVSARQDTAGNVALRRAVGLLLGVIVAATTFWATATVAQWSGRGIARYDARHLDQFPAVILDTKERLYLTDGCQHVTEPQAACIQETALPAAQGQTYRFRYRHFRLLIQGDNQMFLVPDVWSASDSTLVVPMDGSVRVQFQFENDPP
ncbi:MAG TPA: hypothetical protein VE441_08130 [Mycobacterium sp.]|nr:hypothetical protein [Mycobacterium sp.]